MMQGSLAAGSRREVMLDLVMMVDAFAEVPEVPDPLPRHFREDVPLAEDLAISPMG